MHGLNAVFLPEHGWYRVDARGNKPGVTAAFTPPFECLAFPTELAGEIDFPEIMQRPLSAVIDAMREHADWRELAGNLPDLSNLADSS